MSLNCSLHFLTKFSLAFVGALQILSAANACFRTLRCFISIGAKK